MKRVGDLTGCFILRQILRYAQEKDLALDNEILRFAQDEAGWGSYWLLHPEAQPKDLGFHKEILRFAQDEAGWGSLASPQDGTFTRRHIFSDVNGMST